MYRKTNVILWVVMLATAGGLVVVSLGVAEPYLSPSVLPVGPSGGVVAAFVVVVSGIAASTVLGALAWRQLGKEIGLAPDGVVRLYDNPPEGKRTLFAKPDLTGTIGGRQVRVRTYRTNDTATDSTITCTVVETDLASPVEWTAMLAPASGAEIHHEPAVRTEPEHWTDIDGEFAVWGSVTEATARDVLSESVRSAVNSLDSGVAVGNVMQEVGRQMAAEVQAASDGEPTGTFLDVEAGDEEPEPSVTISHTDRRPVLDPAELIKRVKAVTAVADAVEGTER